MKRKISLAVSTAHSLAEKSGWDAKYRNPTETSLGACGETTGSTGVSENMVSMGIPKSHKLSEWQVDSEGMSLVGFH